MIRITLPTTHMSFTEVLQTAIGLALEGHESAAVQLVKRWVREAVE